MYLGMTRKEMEKKHSTQTKRLEENKYATSHMTDCWIKTTVILNRLNLIGDTDLDLRFCDNPILSKNFKINSMF